MVVLVTGAPGNVGTPLLAELAGRGVPVRAGVRPHASAALPLGVQPVNFDFTDPATWPDAFVGVRVMFLLRPPQLSHVARDIVPALAAARDAGVKHVVFLSIQGAARNRLVPHHAIEAWLRGSGIDWTFLRAAYFMQNLITTHAPELAAGEVFVPAGRSRTALVDVRDVAAVAAAVLSNPAAHAGRAYTLTGPAALTYAECAAVFTQTWGRPVRYSRPGPVTYARRLTARGVPLPLVTVTLGIYTAARLGLAAGLSDDVAIVTGRPPRNFRAFAADTPDPRGAAVPAGQPATESHAGPPAVTRRTPPLPLVRIANPVMRALLRSPLHGAVDRGMLLLHLTGRRTGRRYDIPVGHHDLGGRLTVFTNSPWRTNLRGGADIEITHHGRRRLVHANLDEDPASVAAVYQRIIEGLGWKAAQRRLGIAIHVGRTPTRAELEQAVRDSGLSIIGLVPQMGDPPSS